MLEPERVKSEARLVALEWFMTWLMAELTSNETDDQVRNRATTNLDMIRRQTLPKTPAEFSDLFSGEVLDFTEQLWNTVWRFRIEKAARFDGGKP